MHRFFICLIAAITIVIPSFSQNIVLHAPDHFDGPVRDGIRMFPDSLVYDFHAEEIHIPNIMTIGRLGNIGFTNLKKVTFGNIDYVPGGIFMDNNTIEEIVFEGAIGHFDCALVANCPNLRKIIFRGPVSSTGGQGFAHNCPKLDSVIFESTVVYFDLDLLKDSKCPNLTKYSCHGAFLKVYNDKIASTADIDYLKSNPRLIKDLEKTAQWQAQILTAKNSDWMRSNEYQSAIILYPVLKALNSKEADTLKEAMNYAWSLGDEVKTKLDILKESPKYNSEPPFDMTFRYGEPSDRMLRMTRKKFNLDKIAGKGDDISRIKNLLYRVHDNIEHDGSNGLAPGARNLENTYESARRNSCGYNCSALAICLTEALLAVGIPARYITCIPKRMGDGQRLPCHLHCLE